MEALPLELLQEPSLLAGLLGISLGAAVSHENKIPLLGGLGLEVGGVRLELAQGPGVGDGDPAWTGPEWRLTSPALISISGMLSPSVSTRIWRLSSAWGREGWCSFLKRGALPGRAPRGCQHRRAKRGET